MILLNRPYLNQPCEDVKLKQKFNAPGTLYYLASVPVFDKTSGTSQGIGQGGIYTIGAASSDYTNLGRVARLSPGAFTILAIVEPLSTSLAFVSGTADTGTTYNEAVRVNADSLGSASAGKVSLYLRSTGGQDRAAYTTSSVLSNNKLSVIAIQVTSSTSFKIVVDGVDCPLTYQVTNTLTNNSGITDFSLDLNNRNSRGSHTDGSTNLRIYAYVRLPFNISDLNTITSSPSAFYENLFESQITRIPVYLGNSYNLIASYGTYSVSGQTSTILRSKVISANYGTYSFTGQSATITYTPTGTNYTLVAEKGDYTYTGQGATILRSKYITANNGTYTLTGQNATVSYSGSNTITLKAGSWLRYRIIQ